MGEAITANLPRTNPKWNAVRIRDFELIQTACQLTQSKLHLPKRKAKKMAITPLKNVGTRGPHPRVIIGPSDTAPFYQTKSTPKPNDQDGYPALWNHNCENERQFICAPDRKLKAERGQEVRANELWQKIAGRCFFNSDFRLNSQSLAVAFTEYDCIGGTAWPNVTFADEVHPDRKDWDYAFSIWGNSTLGLILYWWHGSRQQSGRANISRVSVETLHVLDFSKYKERMGKAKAIFDKFKGKDFQPAFRADKEKSTRAELDHAVLCDWLGFGEDIYEAVRKLARKWCAEPSVHGGKQRHKKRKKTLISLIFLGDDTFSNLPPVEAGRDSSSVSANHTVPVTAAQKNKTKLTRNSFEMRKSELKMERIWAREA